MPIITISQLKYDKYKFEIKVPILFGIVALEFEMLWFVVDVGGTGAMTGSPVEEPEEQKLFIG